MPLLPWYLAILAGFVVLVLGAEWLVRGASKLAALAGLSPLIIGLTVVAMGTSAPEMGASITAAAEGRGALAIGNALGSNNFNILAILGLTAVVSPLIVAHRLVRVDVPIMLGATVVCTLFAWDGEITRLEGSVLLAGMIAYLFIMVKMGRRESRAQREADKLVGTSAEENLQKWRTGLRSGLLVLVGLVALIVGSHYLVDGASEAARILGLSELIIGLTVIAVGTSLPEVATSVMAAARGERDIAAGNVVGSNILNLLAVVGSAAFVAPDGLHVPESALAVDFPVMIAASFACLPIFFRGYRISRWEGALFLFYYLAYTSYILLDANGSSLRDDLYHIMAIFVIPLTATTLCLISYRGWRSRVAARAASQSAPPVTDAGTKQNES